MTKQQLNEKIILRTNNNNVPHTFRNLLQTLLRQGAQQDSSKMYAVTYLSTFSNNCDKSLTGTQKDIDI